MAISTQHFVRYSGIVILLIITSLLAVSAYFVFKSQLPLPSYIEKTSKTLQQRYPEIYQLAKPILAKAALIENVSKYNYLIDPISWQGVGANTMRPTIVLPQKAIRVGSVGEVLSALQTAKAGSTIVLLTGIYEFSGFSIKLNSNGTSEKPIKLIAERLGDVVIKLKGEGILVDKPFWHFENLHIIGSCVSHKDCEHAFHVVGKGKNARFVNNILQDFNAMIKVNGVEGEYPDDGKIMGNTFFNTAVRNTVNPVTPIDIMQADNWEVSENFIFDFIKGQGNKVSYGAFMKGDSGKGVFSRNLIICNANLQSKNTAIGLSFGGGGSPAKWHRRHKNNEHSQGKIEDNIIMHCNEDVGVYLNRAANSTIKNNILYNTQGIDIRYNESSVLIKDNILSGRINLRDDSTAQLENNIILKRNWFTGKELLDELFSEPENGNFNWKSDREVMLYSTEKLNNPKIDFCRQETLTSYIGAFAKKNFCVDRMNLLNTNRKFINENEQ